MAGDLAEERERRGWILFWLDVVNVMLALWWRAAMEAPIRLLALVVGGLAILAGPALGGLGAVFLVPRWIESPLGWIGLALFWWGGALWTGRVLVEIAPRHGMAACAILATGGAAILIGFGGPAVWRDLGNTDFMLFWMAGLIATAPLLAGAGITRRRSVWSQEQS